MLSVATDSGIPRKVMNLALKLGIHNDCIVAGSDKACDECHSSMSLAFDFHYGHLKTMEEVLAAILDDLRLDAGGDPE